MKRLYCISVLCFIFGCVSTSQKAQDVSKEFLYIAGALPVEQSMDGQGAFDVFSSAIEAYLTREELDDLYNVVSDSKVKTLMQQLRTNYSEGLAGEVRNHVEAMAKTGALRKLSDSNFRIFLADKMMQKYPDLSDMMKRLIEVSNQ